MLNTSLRFKIGTAYEEKLQTNRHVNDAFSIPLYLKPRDPKVDIRVWVKHAPIRRRL